MQNDQQMITKDVSLTICFAALYTVLCFLPISPIIGLPGKTITAAAIIAPLIGIILGPYIGATSTVVGGAIGFFFGVLSPLSFVAGTITALFAGMLYDGKRSLCAFAYFSLLFLFGFYPFVGPVWLYLPLMWFQIAVFLVLVSPLQSTATKSLNSNSNSRLFSAFFVTSLTSTLAGQIAGSLTFELLSWPIFMADVNAWRIIWQTTTFLYPVERIIIALSAALIGASLHRVLKSANLAHLLNRAKTSENA
jgi:predicted membrane protein